jgi:hypothetical protein
MTLPPAQRPRRGDPAGVRPGISPAFRFDDYPRRRNTDVADWAAGRRRCRASGRSKASLVLCHVVGAAVVRIGCHLLATLLL